MESHGTLVAEFMGMFKVKDDLTRTEFSYKKGYLYIDVISNPRRIPRSFFEFGIGSSFLMKIHRFFMVFTWEGGKFPWQFVSLLEGMLYIASLQVPAGTKSTTCLDKTIRI